MDPIPPLTDERLAVSEAVAESFQRVNMMSNSAAARAVTRKPAPISRLDSPVTIRIDSDLVPSLLDQWGASGDPSWEEWLGKQASDALRGQLGL
jgi:hypothetical protein